jgi:hypothetical protein
MAGAIAHVPVTATEIAPGADPILDVICQRLIDGTDVVLPREMALLA